MQSAPPPSAPPASVVRASSPPALAIEEAVEHAAQPLEEILAAPEADRTPAAMLVCIRTALRRLRAIRG